MAALVQWALAVLILYSLDWRRVPFLGTDDPQASSEVRLGLAVFGAIVVVFALNFVWQLIRQPALMDAELRAEMRAQAEAAAACDAKRLAEIQHLKDDLASVTNAEAVLRELSRLHVEGRELYNREADRETWAERLRDWNEAVEKTIRDNFSVSELHRYRTSGSGGTYQTTWSWPDGKDSPLKVRYTSRLMGLNDVIRSGVHLRTALLF